MKMSQKDSPILEKSNSLIGHNHSPRITVIIPNVFSYCLSFLGSFTSLLSLVLLCLSHGITGLEDHMMQKPECQMWAKLENKTLPLQDQGHANCTTNSDCTGFTCKGIYQVSPVHLLSYSQHGLELFLKDNS
jgi:hypothetical protein